MYKKNSTETKYLMRFIKWVSIISILFIFLLLSITLASIIGPMPISIRNTLSIMLHQIPILGNLVDCQWTLQEEIIIVQLRLPRILSVVLVGMALSVAGVIFQSIFRNPMADPYVLGVASGAGFGVSLIIVFGSSFLLTSLIYTIPLIAFISALFTILLVYLIAKTGSRILILRLLLAGIAVSSFFSSMISILLVTAGEDIHAVFSWLFGGFPLVRWEYVNIAAPIIFICLIIIYSYARDMNAMLLGEEQAQQLGVEVENMKKCLIILGSLITAVAVSISGIIGFIGLIVPHITRLIVGPDHRILIPSSALIGAILLILCDITARVILRPIVLPTGTVTAMLGAPFFIYLLIRSSRFQQRSE